MADVADLPRRSGPYRRSIHHLDPQALRRDMRAHAGPFADRRRLGRAVERTLEVVALLALDTMAAAISIYAGVIAHSLFRGNDPLPGLAWRAEGAFLPFACVVLWLVFLNAGLYLPRDRRPGGSKIIASRRYQPMTTPSTTPAAMAAPTPTMKLTPPERSSVKRVCSSMMGRKMRFCSFGEPPQ